MFGEQYPRILYSPPALTSAGEEVIELAESFGLILDPWQRLVLNEALKEREDGQWAAPTVGLMVSRQNGKGAILEALELGGLFLFGERVIIHSAHLMDTSKTAKDRLEYLLEQGGAKFKPRNTNGFEAVEITSGSNAGAIVMFRTRTGKGGLGMSADRVIFDEAMDIDRQAIQALVPTLSARKNPQVWYTGSAVDQRMPAHTHCQAFGGLRQTAIDNLRTGKQSRLCYMEWSIDDENPPEFLDPKKCAQANPAMGYRLTMDKIEAEFEVFANTADWRGFAVQRYGWGDWPTFGDARSEIPLEKWQPLAEPSPQFEGPSVLALYRAPEGGPWAVAGAQRLADGRIFAEIGYAGSDPANVVLDGFVQAVTAWGPLEVIVGRGAAADAIPVLEAAGFSVSTPTQGEEAQACGGLLNAVFADGERELAHGNQDILNAAVKHAIKKELPSGGFVWDRVNESTYPSLMASTLARWALIEHGAEAPAPVIHQWPSDDEISKAMKLLNELESAYAKEGAT